MKTVEYWQWLIPAPNGKMVRTGYSMSEATALEAHPGGGKGNRHDGTAQRPGHRPRPAGELHQRLDAVEVARLRQHHPGADRRS